MNNYTTRIVHLNEAANQDLLGVQIGRFCISFDIPVAHVAADLNVSKSVVYRWFTGKHEIGKHLRDKAETYYRRLLRASASGTAHAPLSPLNRQP
jgi:hypothetical protein